MPRANGSDAASGGDGSGSPEPETAGGPQRKKQKIDGPRPMCTNCEQCQIRKGKCDGVRPVCGWCAANGKPCVYQEKKKPGLKAGYGRDLERRLTSLEEDLGSREDELERKIKELEKRLESHSRMLQQMQEQRLASGPVSHGSSPTALQSRPTVPVPSPSVSAQTHRSPYHAPQTGSAAFASPTTSSQQSLQNIEAFRSNPGPHAPNGLIQNGLNQKAAAPSAPFLVGGTGISKDPDMPPFDLAYDLVDLYFERINPWFPLLNRKTTVNRILSDGEEEDRVLLHAIVATTLRFYDIATTARYIPEYKAHKEHYHEISRRRVILHSFERPSIRSLQALVILNLDMVGMQTGGPGMFLLAAITRCATQLGLFSESFSLSAPLEYPSISTLRASVLPEPQDFIDDESRRRLFWCIYMLDRDTTTATAFDFIIDEATIDRKLPCTDELFAANQPIETRWFQTGRRTDYSTDYPENLGPFSYLIELKGLLTTIHQFLKRPVNINSEVDVQHWRRTYTDINSMLSKWRRGLPFELRNTDQVLAMGDQAVSAGWVLLQMSYYTVFIRMHSSAAYPPYRTPIFTPSYTAAQQCYQAVEKIVALAKFVSARDMLKKQGPPFAFSLWVGARVLLVHGSTVEKYVSSDINFLIAALQIMGKHWPVADRYAKILGRVMDEYTESQKRFGSKSGAVASGGPGGVAVAGLTHPQPPSVTVLADMRRCAFELDTLISGEPTGRGGAGAGGFDASLAWSMPVGSSAGTGARGESGSSAPPELTEIDYLETFNFFNYPRMAGGMVGAGAGAASGLPGPGAPADGVGFNAYYSLPGSDANSQASIGNGSAAGPGFGVPDVNSDWLSTQFA